MGIILEGESIMNNKERVIVLKKVLGLKDTKPEFEAVFRKNYRKLLVKYDEIEPVSKIHGLKKEVK